MENTHQANQEEQKDAQMTDVQPENAPDAIDTASGKESAAGDTEIKKLQGELAEAKDKYLRLYSEFENFRRRTAKEKQDLVLTAGEQVLKNMLPVLDDFERAEKALQGTENKAAEGFVLIYQKFKKLLEQSGVKAMELKAGDEFNADVQEAITQIPAPDESLRGKIVDVVEKGYILNDKVIRYAKVVVGA
jgi:molecular chaperone GrpE